jgi:transglutaminase-like putative cysteine protease
MTVRLRPFCNANQTLQKFNIKVTPKPDGIANSIELEGNNAETIWFSGQHNDMVIETSSLVETHHGDPFNFLITEPGAINVPVKYSQHIEPSLVHYRGRDINDPLVAEFTQEVLQLAEYGTVEFLSRLAEQMPERIKYMIREHGDPWSPAETIKKGRGSCRDLATLFIDICRSVGIAARFVSGYCISEIAAESYMHAWAEVYLPGAGWIGFDPSQGASTLDNHIAVAASHRSQDATPISGNFRGEAEASLEALISISRMKDEVPVT